jgi:hypothetical protein
VDDESGPLSLGARRATRAHGVAPRRSVAGHRVVRGTLQRALRRRWRDGHRPALVLWLDYREREAAGTALAAVGLVAAVGASVHGAYGAVHVRDAALVGLPAVVGVLVSTALQQRIQQRSLSLAFSVVLLAIAANMVFK